MLILGLGLRGLGIFYFIDLAGQLFFGWQDHLVVGGDELLILFEYDTPNFFEFLHPVTTK